MQLSRQLNDVESKNAKKKLRICTINNNNHALSHAMNMNHVMEVCEDFFQISNIFKFKNRVDQTLLQTAEPWRAVLYLLFGHSFLFTSYKFVTFFADESCYLRRTARICHLQFMHPCTVTPALLLHILPIITPASPQARISPFAVSNGVVMWQVLVSSGMVAAMSGGVPCFCNVQ